MIRTVADQWGYLADYSQSITVLDDLSIVELSKCSDVKVSIGASKGIAR